jgi:hypothetical protein
MGNVVKLAFLKACEACGKVHDARTLIWHPSSVQAREVGYCAQCVAETFPDETAQQSPPEAS